MKLAFFQVGLLLPVLSCLFSLCYCLNKEALKQLKELQELKSRIDSSRNANKTKTIEEKTPFGLIEKRTWIVCSVEQDQSEAAFHIDHLFNGRNEELEVLEYFWPRRKFYGKSIESLKSGGELDFCPAKNGEHYLCVNNTCWKCHEHLDGISEAQEKFCKDTFVKADDRSVKLEQDEDDLVVREEKASLPRGKVVKDDVEFWMAQLKNASSHPFYAANRNELADCNYTLEFHMALKYIKKIEENKVNWYKNNLQKEMDRHPEYYQENLKWIKEVDQNTELCAPGLICLESKFCVSCGYLDRITIPKPNRYYEICQNDAEGRVNWEFENNIRILGGQTNTYGVLWSNWQKGEWGRRKTEKDESGQGSTVKVEMSLVTVGIAVTVLWSRVAEAKVTFQ